MTGIVADATNYASSVVLSIGTVIFAMANLATVLAGLVFVITQSTVERGEFSKLVTLELILAFGNRCGSFDDVVDQLLGLVNLVLRVCHDETMKVFFLVAGVGSVRPAFAFLDGSLATNGDFSSGIIFHFLQRVTTRSDK